MSKKYRTLLTNLLVLAALSLMMACSEDSTPQPAEVPVAGAAETPEAWVVEAAPKVEQSVPVAAPQLEIDTIWMVVKTRLSYAQYD